MQALSTLHPFYCLSWISLKFHIHLNCIHGTELCHNLEPRSRFHYNFVTRHFQILLKFEIDNTMYFTQFYSLQCALTLYDIKWRSYLQSSGYNCKNGLCHIFLFVPWPLIIFDKFLFPGPRKSKVPHRDQLCLSICPSVKLCFYWRLICSMEH